MADDPLFTREEIGQMTDRELEAEALELIKLGLRLLPEDEGLDLSDREYLLADTIRLKRTLSRIWSTINGINAALAAHWAEEWGEDLTLDLDGEHYWLAPNKRWRLQVETRPQFAEWLADQTPEDIEKILPPSGLRMSSLGKPIRDSFFSNQTTGEDLRIQSKPY